MNEYYRLNGKGMASFKNQDKKYFVFILDEKASEKTVTVCQCVLK